MMGLHSWLRGQQDDVDMTRDEMHIPPLVEGPKKGGINPPPENFVRPDAPPAMKKPLPYHIAPVEKPSSDHEANVVVQAHQFVEQWKASSAAQQKTIENLQIENTELTLQLESERRKNGVLEADLATAANTIQSLEIERSEYRSFFSVSLDIKKKELAAMERFGIQSPPKKERKQNGKKTKAERPETPEAVTEDRTESDKQTNVRL